MTTVLVVDDEQTLLALLQQIVEEEGYQILIAENGKVALQLIEQQQPQLIISDVMMPIMDGYQLLERIKNNPTLQHIKVALISAAPINRNTPFVADAYLAKPYDLDTIDELLERFAG